MSNVIKTKEEGFLKSIKQVAGQVKQDNDINALDRLQTFLEKAKARLADEPSEEDEDPEYTADQGFHDYDPETEQDEAAKWLAENDPEQQQDDADTEDDNQIDEDVPQREGEFDALPEEEPVDEEETDVDQPDVDQPDAPTATPAPATQEQAIAKPSRFEQPTREDVAEMRQYTRPWEQKARDKTRLEAKPHENPMLHHQGQLVEARQKAHGNRQEAMEAFQASPEYQNADPMEQMELDAKFHNDWLTQNPEHLNEAAKLHEEAHKKGLKAKDIHSAVKDEKIRHVLSGGAQSEDAVSTEEGLQHAGGAKGEEGTVGTIAEDPASSFAAGNQDFLRQYAQDYEKKGKKPRNIEDMMDYDERSSLDVGRLLGDHPALKDRKKKEKMDKFFTKYHPLIAINAHKVLRKLGLDHTKGEVDLGMLHEAGMHGLFQAINDYDHDHPSQASFATHAGNKIKGLMQTALRNQDQIPQEIRKQAKKFQQQRAAPVTVTGPEAPQTPAPTPEAPQTPAPTPEAPKPTGPKVSDLIGKHDPAVQDRFKRINTFRQVHTPKKGEGDK